MPLNLSRESVNAAKSILDHPIVDEIFKDMETTAIEQMLRCAPLDHEMRLNHSNEVKAIRTLRSKLTLLLSRAASLDDEGASE